MFKQLLLLTVISILVAATEASVWVSGSDTINQLGVYGTKGRADASNVPGARRSSISWIDSNGSFFDTLLKKRPSHDVSG